MENLTLRTLTESNPAEKQEPRLLRIERSSLRHNPPVVRFSPARERRVLSYR
jgi:hypothetical protein